MDLDELSRLKKAVEKARRKADRSQGEADALIAQLRRDHKVKTFEEGLTLAGLLKVQADEEEAVAEAKLARFEEEWGDKLKELEND